MYCKKCGSKLNHQDSFCSNCGSSVVQEETGSQNSDVLNNPNPSAARKEPFHKLCCELAYSGTLFWLPLLFHPKEKISRYCANQGLWILILSVAACWILRTVEWMGSLFTSGIANAFAAQIYSFVFIVFIISMAYLAFNGFKCAMVIHRGEKPQSILFFQEHTIIKERGKV